MLINDMNLEHNLEVFLPSKSLCKLYNFPVAIAQKSTAHAKDSAMLEQM